MSLDSLNTVMSIIGAAAGVGTTVVGLVIFLKRPDISLTKRSATIVAFLVVSGILCATIVIAARNDAPNAIVEASGLDTPKEPHSPSLQPNLVATPEVGATVRVRRTIDAQTELGSTVGAKQITKDTMVTVIEIRARFCLVEWTEGGKSCTGWLEASHLHPIGPIKPKG